MQNALALLATFTGLSVPILIFVLIAFIVYLIYGLVSGNGMSLHFGKFSLGLAIVNKKEVVATETVEHKNTPCTNTVCTNPMAVSTRALEKELFIEKTKIVISDYIEDQNDLKKDLMLQQMNFAEEKISELRILLCRQYSQVLSEKRGISRLQAKETTDYKFYRMLVYYILLSKVKDDIIKKGLKENHFLDLSNVEFEQYCVRKMFLIIDTMSENFDTYYQDSLIISRKELFVINDSILNETKNILKSVFENARNISEVYNDKISFNKSQMIKGIKEI